MVGRHCCLPFSKVFENCGITVSGSKSQSSITMENLKIKFRLDQIQ